MAKRVKQSAYAATVGQFLDVSQAYLAIWRTSGPTPGVRHRRGWLCAMPTSGRRHPVQQFQIGGEHVAR
jgi:hypothetical protein